MLSDTGKLAIIIPTPDLPAFLQAAQCYNLYLHRQLLFYSKACKPSERALLTLGKEPPSQLIEETLIQYDVSGHWSEDYKRLTKAFHPSL